MADYAQGDDPSGAWSTVEELELDDAFVEHMSSEQRNYGKHQVVEEEVHEVQRGNPAYFENSGGNKRAPIVMVGPTRAGRILVVPLEPTRRWGVWRPVTAFEANRRHKEQYEQEMANG